MSGRLTTILRETISAASLTPTQPPLCPDISLYLISDDYPKGELPDDEMRRILADPAYWAFCWASGQVLAAYLLSHPELCKGKRVLDLGAGSGVVGIAAAMAGAAEVIACDIDPHALIACKDNADINGVQLNMLDDLSQLGDRVDLLIAADVLYDRDNLPWLDTLQQYADTILIADSRVRDRRYFEHYQLIGEQTATTIPDLDELKEYGNVSIYFRRFSSSRISAP